MGVPGNANALLLKQAAAAAAAGSRSVRLNSVDSAFLNRTPASSSNRKTWTWAGWVKRSGPSTFPDNNNQLFSAGSNVFNLRLDANDGSNRIQLFNYNGSTFDFQLVTTQVFRDFSAWFHLVLALDTDNATSSDRVRLYINGTRVTTFSTASYPSLGFSTGGVNNTVEHRIGSTIAGTNYFSGYLADIHFIDGQALDPTSFGEFDTNGVWQPKAFSGGSYGTNGFHLPFSDNSTAAALGTDTSSNGNTWTVNNISVTAGAGNDSLVDSPTNGSQTDTGVGGEVTGNYATLNPLDTKSTITLSNGSLDFTCSSSGAQSSRATITTASGKWYWECDVNSNTIAGLMLLTEETNLNNPGDTAASFGYYGTTGAYGFLAGTPSTAATFTTGDIIGFAWDADANTIKGYKNNALQFTYSLTAGKSYVPAVGRRDGGGTVNFGQRPFAYTAPSGFKALCTTNLPTPTIADGSTAMDVLTWTGNGASSRSLTGLNFSPDFAWIKLRNSAAAHTLWDSVRGLGSTKELSSSDTAAEGTTVEAVNYGYVSALDSNGLTVNVGTINANYVNTNSNTYVAWTWDAGSSTVTNTQGSITSQVRANASAGFSVVTYTAPSSGAWTTGHGLGVAPQFIITKSRSNTYVWGTYHVSIGNTGRLDLNSTNAVATTQNSAWNNTSPTSTVFSMGSDWAGSGITYVAYCFAPVAGYSAYGSYTGNGSVDGPFVFTGMRPRWILIKTTNDAAEGWRIWDTARSTYNAADKQLFPNAANAEVTSSSYYCDILSNGFKLRTNNSDFNGSGDNVIYAAFAESPFQYARAR